MQAGGEEDCDCLAKPGEATPTHTHAQACGWGCCGGGWPGRVRPRPRHMRTNHVVVVVRGGPWWLQWWPSLAVARSGQGPTSLHTPARTPGGQRLRLGGSCLFKTVGWAGLASDDAPPVVLHGEAGSSSWQWQGLGPPQRHHGGAEDSRPGQLMGTRGVGDDVVEMGRFSQQQRYFLIWPPPWQLSVEAWSGPATTMVAWDEAMSICLHVMKDQRWWRRQPHDESRDEAVATRQ